MCFGLIMHWAVLLFEIPFPGYEHDAGASFTGSTGDTADKNGGVNGKLDGGSSSNSRVNYGAVESGEKDKLLTTDKDSATATAKQKGTPVWLYFFLSVPAIFGVGATLLAMCGLQYIDVSIYQLLRGSGIIFVALMKQHGGYYH